jgi:hypothetical protein
LVPKNLAGIRLVPIEDEIGGQATAEGAQALQQVVAAQLVRDHEIPGVGDVDFDLVAFLETEASTTAAGRRTARLLPHLATCMAASPKKIHAQRDGYPRHLERQAREAIQWAEARVPLSYQRLLKY